MNFDMKLIIEKVSTLGTEWGVKLIGAIVILIIGKIIVKILAGTIKKVMEKAKVDETLIGFLGTLINIALTTVLWLMVLGNLGIQTTSFIAILGAAGLAVGLALQGSLSNLGAGVLLIVFRPFKTGNFITGGGESGTVKEISIFTTTLVTPDNKLIIIPNSKMAGGNITNFSTMPTRRVDLVFGIGYGDDLKKAKDTLWKIVNEDERILKDPVSQVVVGELGDSSVNFKVRVWVNSADYWNVYFDTTEKVKLVFDEVGISIPFPQRDVHIYEEKKAS